MSLEELKSQQQNLILQRAQAMDMQKNCETALGQVGFAIKVLEENQPKPEADKVAGE